MRMSTTTMAATRNVSRRTSASRSAISIALAPCTRFCGTFPTASRGRHVQQPGSYFRVGFPIAVAGTELILKPDSGMGDEAFKRGALPTLDRVGEMIAFFDNEPANCNLAKAMFPEATVVLLVSVINWWLIVSSRSVA